ncbi:MAG: aspartate carbamoyltransferase [Francisellaceae bacterium]|nr:aspartate carbamoyltransferase [Francisellaceae bacterium]
MRNLLSIDNISKSEILSVIDKTYSLVNVSNAVADLAKGKVLTTFFMEPSTRTRLSFEAAFAKMSGSILSVTGKETSAIAKKESLSDSLRVISSYSDVMVARIDADFTNVDISNLECPIINAGDGACEHPTQTLLDLFSMHECFGRLEKLKLGLMGDLLYGRTVHSLVKVAHLFDIELYLLPCNNLELPTQYMNDLNTKGVNVTVLNNMKDLLANVDILYPTRVQQERGALSCDTNIINLDVVTKYGQDHLKIFHPLPRNLELSQDLDNSKYSYYFKQAKNGLVVRQAILSMILEG